VLPDEFPSELYPFTSHSAAIGGLSMHYVDEGSGPPVVLVHGNPTWSFYFRNLIPPLATSHRAIALDHIGMGFSDHPTRAEYPFSLERRIADLGEFIDTVVGEGPVDLVMHDWGGAIGLGWAVAHPDRVRKLVVMNSAGFHPPHGKKIPAALLAARSAGTGETVVRGANAFVEGAVRIAVTRPLSREERRGYRAPYFSWKRRLGVYEFVKDIPINDEHRTYGVIERISDRLDLLGDKPVMLAWGTKDFVFNADYLAEFVRRFPNAEVVKYGAANHLVLDDERVDLIPKIVDFLT
jgi:haloalkane dehalogenase